MGINKTQLPLIVFMGALSLLTGLSGSSTTLALPKISLEFAVSNSTATWVVTVGLIVTSILLVMFGHVGDLLSKSTVFMIGSVLFLAGSLVTGLAPTFYVLLTGRFIQAVGTAMIMANSMGIISDHFTSDTRAEALAAISMFTSLGTISGPAFGGFLISWASWRWIYLFNVPAGLLILLFGYHTLKIVRPKKKDVATIWRNANWTGQNLFTVGVILFFISGTFLGNANTRLWGLIGVALGLTVTIYSFIQDGHAPSPWIDPSLLHNPDYMISILTLLIVMLVNAISNILLPFYLQSYLGLPAFASGLIMMLQSFTMLFITPIAGYLADHWNRYNLTVLGLIALIISQIGYALYPLHQNNWLIIWPIVVNGIGMGLFLSPNNALTMDTVPKHLAGVAGSLNSFARTFGMTIGVSFGAMLMFAQLPGIARITPATGAKFVPAFANVFWLGTMLSFVGLVIVIYRLYRMKKRTH